MKFVWCKSFFSFKLIFLLFLYRAALLADWLIMMIFIQQMCVRKCVSAEYLWQLAAFPELSVQACLRYSIDGHIQQIAD